MEPDTAFIKSAILKQKKGPAKGPYLIVLNGAGTKSRTRDLLITNQLLYQLSYAGKIKIVAAIPGSASQYSKGRPRHPDVAFAGPKQCFGSCRLTQLSYAGKIKIVAAIPGSAAHSGDSLLDCQV